MAPEVHQLLVEVGFPQVAYEVVVGGADLAEGPLAEGGRDGGGAGFETDPGVVVEAHGHGSRVGRRQPQPLVGVAGVLNLVAVAEEEGEQRVEFAGCGGGGGNVGKVLGFKAQHGPGEVEVVGVEADPQAFARQHHRKVAAEDFHAFVVPAE